jgi:hypothetical protein
VTSDGADCGGFSVGGGGVGRLDVAHEAMTALLAKMAALRQTLTLISKRRILTLIKTYPMFWIFLELALGLALFVFLVWWTLPRKNRDDEGPQR